MWTSVDAHHERLHALYVARELATDIAAKRTFDAHYRHEFDAMLSDACHPAARFMRHLRGRWISPPRGAKRSDQPAKESPDGPKPAPGVFVPRDLPDCTCDQLGQDLMVKAMEKMKVYNPKLRAPSRWLERLGTTLMWNHLRGPEFRLRLAREGERFPSIVNDASKSGLGQSGARKLEAMQANAHALDPDHLGPLDQRLLEIIRAAKSMSEVYRLMMRQFNITYGTARKRVHRFKCKIRDLKGGRDVNQAKKDEPENGDADDDE